MLTGGLGGLGDGEAVYNAADGSGKILRAGAFEKMFGFAPGEQYRVGAPGYNSSSTLTDAKRGVNSLPYVQPRLFRGRRLSPITCSAG